MLGGNFPGQGLHFVNKTYAIKVTKEIAVVAVVDSSKVKKLTVQFT